MAELFGAVRGFELVDVGDGLGDQGELVEGAAGVGHGAAPPQFGEPQQVPDVGGDGGGGAAGECPPAKVVAVGTAGVGGAAGGTLDVDGTAGVMTTTSGATGAQFAVAEGNGELELFFCP